MNNIQVNVGLAFWAVLAIIITAAFLLQDPPELNEYHTNVTNQYNYTNITYVNQTVINNCTLEYQQPVQFYPRQQRICKGNVYTYDLKGYSMQPFAYDGDKIHTEKIKFEDLELGDVVVVDKGNGIPLVHAVVSIYPEEFVTAGYNNKYEDQMWHKEQLIGRYCENGR